MSSAATVAPYSRRPAVREREILRVSALLAGDNANESIAIARKQVLLWAQPRAGGMLPDAAWDCLPFDQMSGGRNCSAARIASETTDVWGIRVEQRQRELLKRGAAEQEQLSAAYEQIALLEEHLHDAQEYPLHVEKLVQARLAGGSSPKTACNLVCLLQSIFSLAVDNDLIPKSPVRGRHKPRVTRPEKPVWTPEQLKLILNSVPDNHRNLFQSAMLTGARIGELLGLQWKHVDFESQRLEIKQALWEGELVQPKTEGSIRVVYFGPALLNALTAQRRASTHTQPEDFVFCKTDGSTLNPDVLRRDVLYPTLDRLGIARSKRAAGFHTFRHSAATIVNQRTGNLKLVQRLLGHSNLNTTADVYTHTSADAERGAALALEQAIYGDLFQTVPRFGTWNKNAAVN